MTSVCHPVLDATDDEKAFDMRLDHRVPPSALPPHHWIVDLLTDWPAATSAGWLGDDLFDRRSGPAPRLSSGDHQERSEEHGRTTIDHCEVPGAEEVSVPGRIAVVA